MRRLLASVPFTLLLMAQTTTAEVGTAKILAPWEANGQLFQVAVDKLQFIGTFEGIMYIEHGDGLLDAALFTCPSTQIIHVLSNELEGQGYCTIESPTGDYVYAEFSCDGEPGSCKGEFLLTGGTGKLTGITGRSAMIVRTALSGTSIDQETGGTVSAAKGLAIWPEMRFEVPGKSARTGMLGTGPSEPESTADTEDADESSNFDVPAASQDLSRGEDPDRRADARESTDALDPDDRSGETETDE